jgi:hypothetical protein
MLQGFLVQSPLPAFLMSVIRLLQVLLLAWVVSAAIPLSTLERRTSNFVTTDNNGQFLLDGQ